MEIFLWASSIVSCTMDESDVGRLGQRGAVQWRATVASPWHSCRSAPTHNNSGNSKILAVFVYIPNDDNAGTNFHFYGDLLNGLASLATLHDGFDTVNGGVFNVDFEGPSRNSDMLAQFLSHETLV